MLSLFHPRIGDLHMHSNGHGILTLLQWFSGKLAGTPLLRVPFLAVLFKGGAPPLILEVPAVCSMRKSLLLLPPLLGLRSCLKHHILGGPHHDCRHDRGRGRRRHDRGRLADLVGLQNTCSYTRAVLRSPAIKVTHS